MDRIYAWLAEQAQAGHLPESFQHAFFVRGLLAVACIAPLLGGLSHLVVARRLAFFSTALGQAALTGLSLGILLGEPLHAPYAGIFGFSLLSSLAMIFLKRNSSLTPDTLIGVFLSLTLGLGICLLVLVTKEFNVHQIESVLFGSLLTIRERDLLLLVVVGLAVGWFVLRRYNDLLADSLDPVLLQTQGKSSAELEYGFVLLLCLAITISLKLIGALLVEAMVVIPAAAARHFARGMRSYMLWSIALAWIAGTTGVFLSSLWRLPTGGAVVLALSALFFLSWLARRR